MNKIINGFPIAIAFGLVGHFYWSQLPKQSQASTNFAPLTIDQKQFYEPPADKWNVVNVHDGDTIKIRWGTEEKKVRFACVDAPELSQILGVKLPHYLRLLITKSGNKVSVKVVDVDELTSENGITRSEFIEQFLRKTSFKEAKKLLVKILNKLY